MSTMNFLINQLFPGSDLCENLDLKFVTAKISLNKHRIQLRRIKECIGREKDSVKLHFYDQELKSQQLLMCSSKKIIYIRIVLEQSSCSLFLSVHWNIKTDHAFILKDIKFYCFKILCSIATIEKGLGRGTRGFSWPLKNSTKILKILFRYLY